MGYVKLEPLCPRRSALVASGDPEPNWSVDDLLSELNNLEARLGYQTPSPLKQPPAESGANLRVGETDLGGRKAFVISVSDDDMDDDSDCESDEGEVDDGRVVASGTCFSCNDLDLSDSEESDDEWHSSGHSCPLMHRNSLEEDILFELEREFQLKVKAEVRSTLSALELHHQKTCEKSESAMLQLEKYIEERREIDRRIDKQYQRKIAEVLDDHLSVVQRDHEQRSQIEERRIRDDAAIEEARRKERALYEEKMQREKAKAEAEAREKAAKAAEERRLALEAEAAKRAAEAAAKEAERAAAEAAQREDNKVKTITERVKGSKGDSSSQESGIKVMAADAALQAEAYRLRVHNDVSKQITSIPQKDFEKYGRKMFRIVSQITGTQDAVRSKAHDIISTLNDSAFPRSISVLIFAQKVVSVCESPKGTDDRFAFACSRVILYVSSQVPEVMDFVLAEFHKACIYTVPKHLHPTTPAAQNKDYWKSVGYQEEENKMESVDSYLNRMQTYIKLYAALIQTEMPGIRNPHGLEQGWAWLAMFLNTLPPIRATACVLDAFLRMAGFALFRRYKTQFLKLLYVIAKSYLPALKRRDDPKLGEIVTRLEGYLDDKVYRKEPNGWRLQEGYLLSEACV